MMSLKKKQKVSCLLAEVSQNSGKDSGNILVLGIGVWFIVLALAFAVMVVGDLYAHKRDAAAEADYIALSLADDVDDSSYYGDESDFHLSDAELLRRARKLARSDSEIVQVSSSADGSIHIRLKRTVSAFTIPAFTNLGTVDLYADSTAYLREYQEP